MTTRIAAAWIVAVLVAAAAVASVAAVTAAPAHAADPCPADTERVDAKEVAAFDQRPLRPVPVGQTDDGGERFGLADGDAAAAVAAAEADTTVAGAACVDVAARAVVDWVDDRAVADGSGGDGPSLAGDDRDETQLAGGADENVELFDPTDRIVVAAVDAAGNTTHTSYVCAEQPSACRVVADIRADRAVSAGRTCAQQWFGDETATVTGTQRGRELNMELSRHDGCAEEEWQHAAATLGLPVGTDDAPRDDAPRDDDPRGDEPAPSAPSTGQLEVRLYDRDELDDAWEVSCADDADACRTVRALSAELQLRDEVGDEQVCDLALRGFERVEIRGEVLGDEVSLDLARGEVCEYDWQRLAGPLGLPGGGR